MSLRFKRNYPLIILVIAIIAFFALLLGNQRVVAYTTRPLSTASAAPQGYNYANSVALFDDTVVHSVQVIMDTNDYDQMLATYKNAGEKDYFKADVVIDGVRVNEVGIRLKGNASLRTALGGGRGFGGFERPDNGARPEGARGEPPAGFTPPENGEPAAGGMNPREMPEGGAPGRMAQSASGEVKIPFLIKFDEYVAGQTYQGYQKLSIRNYGTSYDEAMLAEPLTNNAVQLAGLPATETAFSGFAVNEAEEILYVISEVVDDQQYLARYFSDASGVLYKAEVGSTLSYVDENPSSYARSFSQETRVNDADFAPLIAFMRFLDQSDDASFESDLPKWLDVDSFAAYLALNNLLVNTDSMIGMNNNYYLYYEESQARFTLLMWDANESLSKLGGNASYDLYFASTDGPGGRGGPGGGMGGGENVLMERFLANPTYKALYEQKLAEIYPVLFESGALSAEAERFSALIHSVNDERGLVEADAYDAAVTKVLTFINQRKAYLETTALLGE